MTDLPPTRVSLVEDLTALGLRAGDTVIAHASLKAIGQVPGGRVAVLSALLEVLGPDGTIVVPTQTAENSDPALWENPPVPPSWWPVIREHTPAFDPATWPSRGIGQLAEAVRTWPGAVRSDHPQTSFAAVGARAESLMAGHALTSRFGEQSPLAALERVDARVLLLGVGFDVCTAFHLSEYRAPVPTTEFACAVRTDAGREWVTFTDVEVYSEDFDQVGAAYEKEHEVNRGTVGNADSRLFSLPDGVAFAAEWIRANR